MAMPTHSPVETLLERIGALVVERQALRERGVSRTLLERNRLRIARTQRELSFALIARYLPKPAREEAA